MQIDNDILQSLIKKADEEIDSVVSLHIEENGDIILTIQADSIEDLSDLGISYPKTQNNNNNNY